MQFIECIEFFLESARVGGAGYGFGGGVKVNWEKGEGFCVVHDYGWGYVVGLQN
jgi:hypothetical protein